MNERVPVFAGLHCIELAGPARVHSLAQGRNAKLVRRHKDGKLIEIQLLEHGNDIQRAGRRGNPQKDVTSAESETNPRGVWTFKHQRQAQAA
jgi:hypothetical protein